MVVSAKDSVMVVVEEMGEVKREHVADILFLADALEVKEGREPITRTVYVNLVFTVASTEIQTAIDDLVEEGYLKEEDGKLYLLKKRKSEFLKEGEEKRLRRRIREVSELDEMDRSMKIAQLLEGMEFGEPFSLREYVRR